MNNKAIFCGNCGKRGHVYKNCYKPIISLGIMCVKYDDLDINEIIKKNKERGKIFNRYQISNLTQDQNIKNMIENKLKFLMVCRKQSIGYIELIRGNYNLENYSDIGYIKNIFKLMTKHEIENIKTKDFDFLWNDLWILSDNSHKKEYDNSKNKFHKLIEGVDIIYMNETYHIDLDYFVLYMDKETIKWNEPEWEFPKGRRNIKEEDLPCAIREFEEETNFQNRDYKLLDLKPISEIFMGNNGINYKHTYYLAQSLLDIDDIPKIDENNIYQKIEISDIQWLTFREAIDKIRDYNLERKEILKKVYNLLYFNIYHYLIHLHLGK